MDIIDVILLSIVEGITEFLPVSSTAHLILASNLLKIPLNEFVKTFEIAIQLGAILSVAVLFRKKLIQDKNLALKALVAFIPTGILGVMFYKVIKNLLGAPEVALYALFIGGVAIILLELFFKQKNVAKTHSVITYRQALVIGLIQAISMVPGVSRAAASIFGGMAVGLSRKNAVEFSFLLAVPTMAAATGLDLVKSAPNFDPGELFYLLVGVALSFIVALIAIKWLVKYVQTHDFIPFGVYRIIFSVVYYILFLR